AAPRPPRVGLVRPPPAVQHLPPQPLHGRLLMDFLGSQPLSVEQGVKGLVVLAPLPIALSQVQQVMGAALQRRQPRRSIARACSTTRPASPSSTATDARWMPTLVGPKTVQKSLRSGPSRWATTPGI